VLKDKGIEAEKEYAMKVVELVRERADFVSDLWEHSDFFFRAPREFDPKAVKKRWKEGSSEKMEMLMEVIRGLDDFAAEKIEKAVKSFIEEKELGMGAVMNAWRICLVGELKGPGLFEISEMIGKEETLSRMKFAIESLA
jgi:glutamyl-tRNA synthetase